MARFPSLVLSPSGRRTSEFLARAVLEGRASAITHKSLQATGLYADNFATYRRDISAMRGILRQGTALRLRNSVLPFQRGAYARASAATASRTIGAHQLQGMTSAVKESFLSGKARTKFFIEYKNNITGKTHRIFRDVLHDISEESRRVHDVVQGESFNELERADGPSGVTSREMEKLLEGGTIDDITIRSTALYGVRFT